MSFCCDIVLIWYLVDMKRVSRFILVLIATASLLSGCVEQITTRDPLPNASVTVGDEAIEATTPTDEPWPFRPTRLRVHPLTRAIMDDQTNEPIIEVRIEFIDPQGHTTKGHGQIRIDLLAEKGTRNADEPIAIWSRDLRDLKINFEHYDVVTQTYLFRLRIEGNQLPSNPRINAYYLAADGLRLEAKYQMQQD